KRYSTVQYIKMVKNGILPPFDKRIWQRNYWEHIVRNENEYKHIAQYIVDNPPKWDMDKLNGGDGNRVMEPLAQYNDEAWMI
ncbi:MAG: transposase, partial [Thermodesulfobacteriota bacterium]|nr:transposase [Thermodesulfobacteriota bacterium]